MPQGVRAGIFVALVILVGLVALPAKAAMLFEDGPLSITALGSDCSSEEASKVLHERGATTPAKRADVMLAGQFIPACWAEDKDRDIIVIDRKGSGGVIFRRAFRLLKEA